MCGGGAGGEGDAVGIACDDCAAAASGFDKSLVSQIVECSADGHFTDIEEGGEFFDGGQWLSTGPVAELDFLGQVLLDLAVERGIAVTLELLSECVQGFFKIGVWGWHGV